MSPPDPTSAREHHRIDQADVGGAGDQLDLSGSSSHNDDEAPQGNGVLSKIERHPYISGAVLGLAALGARVAILTHDADSNTSVGNPAQITRTAVTDLNGDGRLEANDRLNMGPVLSRPIGLEEGQVPEELKPYNPKFVAAYRSVEGEAFNFFATTQPGEESALNHHFELNPQSIEYILTQISSHIQDAPENSSKQRIIDNLRAIKNGDKESITNIVIDVSPTAGCMDPSYQLVKFTDAICASQGIKSGFTGFTTQSQLPDQQSVVIAAGDRYVAVKTSGATERSGEKNTVQSGPIKKVSWGVRRDVPEQENATGHEMVHALSGENSDNTYREGDPDHEITAWLIDGYHYNRYDFSGAQGRSPFIGRKIEKLVASGILPPILSVKK